MLGARIARTFSVQASYRHYNRVHVPNGHAPVTSRTHALECYMEQQLFFCPTIHPKLHNLPLLLLNGRDTDLAILHLI